MNEPIPMSLQAVFDQQKHNELEAEAQRLQAEARARRDLRARREALENKTPGMNLSDLAGHYADPGNHVPSFDMLDDATSGRSDDVPQPKAAASFPPPPLGPGGS